MTLENRDTEELVTFQFDNVDRGGAEGTNQRNEAVAFLEAQGCN